VPTRRGVTVGVAGVILVGAGLGLGYKELTALGVVALVALAVALLWAGWPPRLEVTRTVDPDRVVRGDWCRASVDLRSTARWRSQLVSGEERLRGAGFGDVPVAVPTVRLRSGASTRTWYRLPTQRRGVLDVGPLTVSRQDPLGLVSSSRTYGGTTRLWVHPRSHQLLGVPVGSARSLDGVVDAVQYGSITFHALREYVPGDDLRHVHWRTSARVGELMVREHVDTSLPRMVVLVDDRAGAHHAPATGAPGRPDPPGWDGAAGAPDSLEEVAEAAASVLIAALRAELTVELHLVSGRQVDGALAGAAGVAAGPGAIRPYLDVLAEMVPTEAALQVAVQKLRQRHRGDTLVLLTGTGSVADLQSIGLLRDVYPTVVVGVLGTDPETGTSSALAALPGVITITAATATEFAGRWDGVSSW
jgi:uncharacterized protein (DUF58 family)